MIEKDINEEMLRRFGANNKVDPLDERSRIVPKSVNFDSAFNLGSDEIGKRVSDSPRPEEKQKWSNSVEFLLSCVAMSVGLGKLSIDIKF